MNEEDRKKLNQLLGLELTSTDFIGRVTRVFEDFRKASGVSGHCIDSGNYAMLCYNRNSRFIDGGFTLNFNLSHDSVTHNYYANKDPVTPGFLLMRVDFRKNIGLRNADSQAVDYYEELINLSLSKFKDSIWLDFAPIFIGYANYLNEVGYKCKAFLIRDDITMIFLNKGQEYEEITLNFFTSDFTSYK